MNKQYPSYFLSSFFICGLLVFSSCSKNVKSGIEIEVISTQSSADEQNTQNASPEEIPEFDQSGQVEQGVKKPVSKEVINPESVLQSEIPNEKSDTAPLRTLVPPVAKSNEGTPAEKPLAEVQEQKMEEVAPVEIPKDLFEESLLALSKEKHPSLETLDKSIRLQELKYYLSAEDYVSLYRENALFLKTEGFRGLSNGTLKLRLDEENYVYVASEVSDPNYYQLKGIRIENDKIFLDVKHHENESDADFEDADKYLKSRLLKTVSLDVKKSEYLYSFQELLVIAPQQEAFPAAIHEVLSRSLRVALHSEIKTLIDLKIDSLIDPQAREEYFQDLAHRTFVINLLETFSR